MPDLTETGVEFTDLANSLTTGQLKITYSFAPRVGKTGSPEVLPPHDETSGIQGIAARCWRMVRLRLAKAVSR